MISTLFGTAEADTARTLIGGSVIADTRNDLLKQLIVAVANKTGGGGGSGDVVGPASSTDTAIAAFDGATGKLLKDSNVLVGVGTLTFPGAVSGTAVLQAPPVAGSATITLPSVTGTLATLGANGFTGAQIITPSSAATPLTLTGGTVTTALPVLDMTQTWNAAGVTFPGIKFNVTSTASAAGSTLLDLQVSSTSQFKVRKDGYTFIKPTAFLVFGNGDNTGVAIGKSSSGQIFSFFNEGINNYVTAYALDMGVYDTGAVKWSNSASPASFDTFLYRKAGATIQMGADAAGVTNQMFTAASRITSDGVGANLTIAAGNGRGAAGGSLILSYYTTAGAATIGTLTEAMRINTLGQIILTGLPTSDPGVVGALYRTAGAVMISI